MRVRIQVITIALLFFGLALFAWIKPADAVSDSELRKLAQFPEISMDGILSGEFARQFDDYAVDQFPLREKFRSIKALTYTYVYGQLDNNGIYLQDGYAAKMEYPYDESSVNYAVDRINYIYDRYLADSQTKCYVSIIPDKNYYLASGHWALSMDYGKMIDDVRNGVKNCSYIDIIDTLTIEDYYHTDTHWDQSSITGVAEKLAGEMGTLLDDDYEIHEVTEPFYGVYYGQAALPIEPDKMKYLTLPCFDKVIVNDLQNGKVIPIYDEGKMKTRSPYDLFLGGSLSLITIENEEALTDKELIVFRDSYASSLMPLLISGYKKITIVDIRYLPSERVGNFVEFSDQDVLFIYSTSVLNHSSPLK